MYILLYRRVLRDMHISVTDLRLRLAECLDLVNRGEEVNIIRKSLVVAKLVPAHATMGEVRSQQAVDGVKDELILADGRIMKFREYGLYEDLAAVSKLYQPSETPNYHRSPSYFQRFNGEFWVAELQNEVVAAGGFMTDLSAHDRPIEVRIVAVQVEESLRSEGVAEQFRILLTFRAKKRGYTVVK